MERGQTDAGSAVNRQIGNLRRLSADQVMFNIAVNVVRVKAMAILFRSVGVGLVGHAARSTS
jgi:hypothetical protein